MKKIVNTVLTTLMIISMFCNVVFAENDDLVKENVNETLLIDEKQEDVENIARKDYDSNVELARSLEIDLDTYLNNEENIDSSLDCNVEHNFARVNSSLGASDIINKDLPEEVTVNLFDPLVLYFDLKPGMLVTNVIWYLEGPVFSEPHKMEGKIAHSNLLIIPSLAFRYSDELYIEAEFTYYDFINKESKKGFTGTTKVNIDQSITESKSEILNLGDFSIRPGQTLYLDLLGIGKGKVSLSKDGKDITLNNVEFSYDSNELYTDRILTMNRGISYYSYKNEFTDINVNLIGENKISNMFRRTNIDEDGGTLCIVVSGDGFDFVFNPNININGPGTLEIYGGENCIEGFGHVVVDTKLKLSSSKYIRKGYDTPARIGNGIYCVCATLTKNADVDMDIAGRGICANLLVDESYGNITIDSGAKLNIVNTSYIRHPWEDMFLPSKTYGLSYTNALSINGANINMKFIADADLYKQYEKDYGETAGNAYIAIGIATENKGETTTSTLINDSVINITTEVINVEEDDDFSLIRAYGIDTSDIISKTEEREHSKLNINDSKININIGDTGHVYSSVGILASDAYIKNSDIFIETKGNEDACGIKINEKANVEHQIPFVLDVTDSNIKIDSISDSIQGKSYGVIGGDAKFTYDDETKSFVVNANDGTIMCYIGSGDLERFDKKNYKPTKIALLKDTKIVDNLPINVVSLKKTLNLAKDVLLSTNETNKNLTTSENVDKFIVSIYSFKDKDDEHYEVVNGTNIYNYYETIFSGNNIASNIVIRKIIVNPTPIRPYVAPKTGIN